jgi:hypothetical protein
LAVAGGVISAVSQMTVDDDANQKRISIKRMRRDNENLPEMESNNTLQDGTASELC